MTVRNKGSTLVNFLVALLAMTMQAVTPIATATRTMFATRGVIVTIIVGALARIIAGPTRASPSQLMAMFFGSYGLNDVSTSNHQSGGSSFATDFDHSTPTHGHSRDRPIQGQSFGQQARPSTFGSALSSWIKDRATAPSGA